MLKNITLLAVAALVLAGTAIAEPIQWTVEEGGNGHWYDLVRPDNPSNWCYLQSMADEQTYEGMPGYLVTITSQYEQDWIFSTYGCELNNWIVMGSYQPPNSPEPSGGWAWITGEAWEYTNWALWIEQEPNNGSGEENYGMFAIHVCDGGWNDYGNWYAADWEILGYIVEYGDYNPSPVDCIMQVISEETTSWGEIKKAYR